MIVFLENLHNTLDELLGTKKKNEQLILYAIPFLILGFLSYQFITPISEKKIFEKKQKRIELKRDIKTTKEYLAKKPEILEQMKNISNTNKLLSAKLQQQIAQNAELSKKMATIDFMYLNDKNSVDFIDNLAILASKNKATILAMTNSIHNKDKGVFKKEMSIDMNCSGDFNGLLSFANDIESAKMFAKIEKINMSYGKKINAEIQISVSGL